MKSVKYILALIAASGVLILPNAWSQTPTAPLNAIESLQYSQQGGETLVKIQLKDTLTAAPNGFVVSNPARVALDFPATANGLGKNTDIINQGDLSSINIVQVGDRTRLVLNLLRPLAYTTRIEGKELLVTLKSASVAAVSAPVATRFVEESVTGKKHNIRDIAFRRGKEGEGRVVVDLSDAGTGIDIRQQGAVLVVDFLKTSVPENLRRRLDVTDFATPITGVTTAMQGDNVRMTITPKGLWEHNAYQTDNQFVVEVRPVIENPNKLVQGTRLGYQGPRVSINYQNGEIRALLRLMAEELGLNAVISETVTGTTTLVLKDVPADQVIDLIFKQKGLDMRKNGNVLLIAPRDELSQREKLEFEAQQQISELEPVRMEGIVLNYQKAAELAKLLSGQGAPGSPRMLSKRGSVTADTVTNTLFVNDIPSKLDEIRKFTRAIDVGSKQVLIEARVVEASDSFNKDIGVRMTFLNQAISGLGKSGVYLGGGQYGVGTRSSSGSIDAAGNATVTSSFVPPVQSSPQTAMVNLPSFSNSGGAFSFSLFNSSLTKILNVELAALESDGKGKVISSPRVVTANNVQATIEDGTEIPYVTPASGNNPASVSFKNAKLSLKTTPQITPEGRVRMKLEVTKDEPDWTRQIQGNPPIKTSKVETDVVVENGGTVVIGGVFTMTSSGTNERVPLLGDIPLLGNLFKVRHQENTRRELLIFITPRVLDEKLELR